MICSKCQSEFEYLKGEEDAYKRFSAPLPENCPNCRKKRRMAFRNERKLYHNKSCKSGKQIIALYPPDSPFKIVDSEEWQDDSFDATEYGRDYDFSKPFFEQFKALQQDVPRWSKISLNCENSDFANNCANTNNSYLAFSCHDSERLYYCVRVNRSTECVDCYNLAACEYCSNCVDCEKCHNVHFSQSTENSHDSYYLFDCLSCSDCILCTGQRNSKYMILNKQYTKDEYKKLKEDFIKKIWGNKEWAEKSFKDLKKKTPRRNVHNVNSENCTGNFIVNSRNVINGFNATNCEDCMNVYNSDRLKNCYDNQYNDKSELCLECDTCYEVYNCKFSTYFVTSKNVQYCDQCFFLDDCFGCIGLKRQRYVILNKQYSETDYKIMLNKIRSHMRETGEYGKPLPATLSAFAYNETVAQEAYPLTKEEAEKEGYFWHEEVIEAKHFGKPYEMPSSISKIDESICKKILTCEISGKNYKIIPQEYKFHKKFNLPLPRRSPDQRYEDLRALRTKENLRKIKCADCGEATETTYSKEDGLKIICEKCYLKTVY